MVAVVCTDCFFKGGAIRRFNDLTSKNTLQTEDGRFRCIPHAKEYAESILKNYQETKIAIKELEDRLKHG